MSVQRLIVAAMNLTYEQDRGPVQAHERVVVTYADHVAALRACEARVTERHNAEHEDDRLAAFQNGYDAATVKERQRSVLLIADAYGKALAAAREAVAAARPHDFPYIERDDYSTAWEYAQDCMGAAIDALKGEQA